MIDTTELGVRIYGIDYHDRTSLEVQIAATRIALDARTRQCEQALHPLFAALEDLEGRLGGRDIPKRQRPAAGLSSESTIQELTEGLIRMMEEMENDR